MDVLKIATAGSVDDGKSTLIGRLLYDTKSLTNDKLEAIEKKSKQLGFDYLDFSLATDGLVAEREQGITIDVAHIYFSTEKRSYIIADTPGHEEYTRNMVTGASTSQVAIILVDARKGILEQTHRHLFISNLLRMKHLIVAVNKMDLVEFKKSVFDEIKSDFTDLLEKSNFSLKDIKFIPVSALHGENVITRSTKMPWYTEKSLLNTLEEINPSTDHKDQVTRFPVQSVIRPKTEEFHDFRGFSGKIYGQGFKQGDEVQVLPSNTTSRIKEIFQYNKKLEHVSDGQSVTITLEDEINLSRGDLLVKKNEIPAKSQNLSAVVTWMDEDHLTANKKYYIQHNTNVVLSKISAIHHLINTDFSGITPDINQVKLNETASVTFQLSKDIYTDPFSESMSNGRFIIIDPSTKTTAGVGFIQ